MIGETASAARRSDNEDARRWRAVEAMHDLDFWCTRYEVAQSGMPS